VNLFLSASLTTVFLDYPPSLSLYLSPPTLLSFFFIFSYRAIKPNMGDLSVSLLHFSLSYLAAERMCGVSGRKWVGFGYGGLYKEKKTESNQENDTETNFPLSNKQKRQITKRNASIG
jgi:hypothetical protein